MLASIKSDVGGAAPAGALLASPSSSVLPPFSTRINASVLREFWISAVEQDQFALHLKR
jgi:hypothetical protein